MSKALRVCVYCGSRVGRDGRFLPVARDFGTLLADRGLELVYGGGKVGLMGAVADGALAGGGRVHGVIPRSMVEREIAHDGVDLYVVETMHERKAQMEQLSDAFVALPGGTGTLDELFEMWTWAQLGLHGKPLGLLDVDGYWRPLVACVDHMVDEGFLRPDHRAMLVVSGRPDELLDRLGERIAAVALSDT